MRAGFTTCAGISFLKLPLLRHGAQIIVVWPPAHDALSIENSRSLLSIGACSHDLLHHGDESLLICLAQIGNRLTVRRTRRHFHLPEQCRSGFCQPANLRPAISTVD